MTVEVTPPLTVKRQYPHVDAISDWRAQQSIRLLWDRVFDLEARLQAVTGTQGDLVSAVNTQEDQLSKVTIAAGEALSLAQAGRPGTGEGGGLPEGPNTMPNYGAIVANVLATKFVQPPVVAKIDGDKGKAQLTRLAAWEIYQIDPRVRLFAKGGTNSVNGRSTDLIVQGTDGSFADVTSYNDKIDPTTITSHWGAHGPDKNTTDDTRWIVPTLAIADEPGPLTRI